MARLIRIAVTILALSSGSTAGADNNRAYINYLIHCQGCHGPEAVGVVDRVPRMKDFLGYFLHSTQGREFLVRVPGVSTSSLSDSEAAELMNWLIKTYSVEQAPQAYVPYTEAEVSALRKRPEPDPEKTRRIILAEIATSLPALAEELAASNK